MKEPLIRLENVTKYYSSEGGIGLGIHKVNASFNIGEFVIITGSSGSGKTTLLNVISGMDTYEEGAIYINGEDTSYYGSLEYEEYRRLYISFIFQNYNLVESFNVLQNVELALVARGLSKKERRNKAITILKEVGLENRLKNKVTKLSGGEKQRVAIARALASDAPIVVCDEITGNLDSQTSIEIIELLRRVSKNKLVLLVSHDPEEAIKYATRIITMHDGQIDKDFETGLKPNDCDIELPKTKQISFIELVKLSFRNIASTPKKFIFMLLILFISSFLFTYLIAIYNKIDNSIIDAIYGAESSQGSYEERIIVKKADNTAFTESQINELTKINNVKNVIKTDYPLSNAYYILNDKDLYNKYFYIRSINDISKNDLTIGRLPQNSDEVVLQAQSFTNKEKNSIGALISLPTELMGNNKQLKVVGLIESFSSYTNYCYLIDSMLQDYHQQIYVTSLDYKLVYPEGTPLTYNVLFKTYDRLTSFSECSFVIDNTLNDNEIVASFLTYNDELKYQDGHEDENVKIVFSNFYESNTIEDCKIIIKEKKYDPNKEEDYKYMNQAVYYGNVVYFNQNTYNKITSNNIYQVSLTTTSKDVNQNVVKALEAKGYFGYSFSVTNNDQIQQLLSYLVAAINAYIIFYFAIFFVVIIVLTFIILRNTMKSQQKNYLIMRSLGIDGNKIKLQIYSQMVLMSIIALILVITIWGICQIKRFNAFTNVLADLSFGKLIIAVFIIIIMAFYIAFRYTIGVLHSAIVSKEME